MADLANRTTTPVAPAYHPGSDRDAARRELWWNRIPTVLLIAGVLAGGTGTAIRYVAAQPLDAERAARIRADSILQAEIEDLKGSAQFSAFALCKLLEANPRTEVLSAGCANVRAVRPPTFTP